tara:strand:- start:1135 stop:1647 length:513 start_codon:yes stop_codon:yes gene_type:complete
VHVDDIRGRFIAHYFFDELEKIAQQDAAPLVKEEQDNVPEEITRVRKSDEEMTPGQIFGTEIQKKKDGTVKAFPIFQPPPGFTFRPDLQGFVPDPQQPGWMNDKESALADAKNSGYTQAQQENTLKQMKSEATNFVEQRIQPEVAPPPPVQPPTPQPMVPSAQPIKPQSL